jgi:uncharacterized phage-associated protein
MKARAIDVADYILKTCGAMSAMKLQKLTYYSQAWHLVWEDEELFNEEIQAWVNGPVVPDLYERHRGSFKLVPGFFKGNISNLSKKNKDAIDLVIKFYGDKDAQWLSDLTHMEYPWRLARQGVSDGDPCDNIITKASMQEYYSSI